MLITQELDNMAYPCLNSLTAQIAILNTAGEILAVNKAWVNFSKENGGFDNANDFARINYLTVCKNTVGPESESALSAYSGISSVIGGRKSTFTMRYPCDTPKVKRWFVLRVTSIDLDKEKRIVVSHEDITDQANQEIQIKELLANAEKSKEDALLNELKLKQTHSLAMIGGWEFDLATDEFLFNDNFYEIYHSSISEVGGYKMSSEEYTMRFVHPDDRTIVETEIQKVIETEDPNFSNHLEHRIIFNNGETGHISVKFFVSKDKAGKTIKLYGVNQNITDKKKKEEELIRAKESAEANEKHYKDLFNNLIDEVHVWEVIKDANGGIIDWKLIEANPQAIGKWGKSLKEIVGKTSTEIFGEDARAIFLPIVKKIFETGKSHNWQTHFPPTNQYLSFVSIPFDTYFISSGHDISEIKIAEIELKNAKEKAEETKVQLEEAQTIAKVGSWSFDPKSEKIEWSDETFSIWGFDPSKSAPQYDEMVSRVHIDGQETFTRAINEAINEAKPYDIESRICLSTGEEKVVRNICKPITSSTGEVIKLVGATQDMTAQKEMEQAQVKNERLKAMGEMAASIAHDFNNSLQVIMGNVETMKLKNNVSPESVDYLGNIESIVSDVAERVVALQKFSDTLDNDKNVEPVNLNLLIENSIQQSRPIWKDAMEKEGLEIKLETALGEIPDIRGNHGELKSVIHNLIKNSIEAMPKGGDFVIKTGQSDKHVFARFTDTGIGMNEETKRRIFDPFFTTKGYTLGRGLGMSGVYKVVKKHAGDITITSELNKGTSIELIFPINIEQEKNSNELNTDLQISQLDVLWVDDDINISESSQEIMELLGHNCHTESNGKNALEYIKNHHCDLVVTDIGMPIMNGWELAKEIRNIVGDKIKIVVVSGWAIEEKEMKDNHVDYSIQKPFAVDALKKMFKSLAVRKE